MRMEANMHYLSMAHVKLGKAFGDRPCEMRRVSMMGTSMIGTCKSDSETRVLNYNAFTWRQMRIVL